jgi:hypothetical protein
MKELQAQGKTFELTPLCNAIPELAEMDASEEWVSLQSERIVGISSEK